MNTLQKHQFPKGNVTFHFHRITRGVGDCLVLEMLVSSQLPVLQFHSPAEDVRPFAYPKEREVNRMALIDVSPDREDYLQGRSTEEIRADLKLRPGTEPEQWDWLYQRVGGTSRSETTRNSTELDYGAERDEPKCHSPRLLQFDDSILSAKASARRKKSPRISDFQGSLESLNLTVAETLVSPRALGPTHILVTYESRTTGLRPAICEMPINDFLFSLNAPNLCLKKTEDGVEVSSLPKRIQDELPRVLMVVPHVDTFPELMVYLHNKNQAEIFRNLVPEWILDTIHPLRAVPPQEQGVSPEAEGCGTFSCLHSLVCLPIFRRRKNKGRRNPVDPTNRSSVADVAQELVKTARNLGEEELLVSTMVRLNALSENLRYIGYFGKELWLQLDITREILLKAVSTAARL